LSKQVHVDRINEDIEGGIDSGVTTAPALFINGNRYIGHWNMTEFIAAIIAASQLQRN
jgi:protein-disulfide isomerase